jgi:hypothetical protein
LRTEAAQNCLDMKCSCAARSAEGEPHAIDPVSSCSEWARSPRPI